MYASLTGKVFVSPPRRSDETVKMAVELGVSTLASAAPEPWGRDHVMEGLRRFAGQGTVAGPAVTVWNPPGNNTMVRFGIDLCQPGDVLVMTTPTDGAAQWGDLAHEWAHARSIAGVVIDGSVRDLEYVRTLGLGLWGRSVNPRQALKQALGYVNAPVKAAGVTVSPGDLIVADDDGVLVIPADDIDWVLELATSRAEREAESRKDLAQGRISPHLSQIFDLDGIEHVSEPWSTAAASGESSGS